MNNQKGQSVMEYLILSSLIGIFCIAAITSFGKTLKNKFYDMKEEINRSVLKDLR